MEAQATLTMASQSKKSVSKMLDDMEVKATTAHYHDFLIYFITHICTQNLFFFL